MRLSNLQQEDLPRNSFLLTLLALMAICVLGCLLILPLPWQQQAILGAGTVALAIVVNLFSRSHGATLALVAVSVFSTLRYAYWRVTQTWQGLTSAGHLHEWDTVFVLILLLAEFYAFITLFLGYFQTLRPLHRPPVPLPQDERTWPTVDVFIPTYNEPLSVVRPTVMAALAMDYPAEKIKVFVLDDGRREEFRQFAASVGAGYVTRNNNAHAKAGNINHALELTRGELIAIFDSDHAPTRSFLQATLGWFFHSSRLAMVQTPHHFYSPDPFERNLGQFRKIPNEGELFHRFIQDGNDLWNASFFCGSCAVLRRRALHQIGGIAVETVTEDAHTALRLQRRGWETAYINIPQAAGLATESLAAHIGQRVRWARGMIQILRIENPLFIRGLKFSQRLCYLNATTHFLFATPRLIFLTVPLVYLALGMVNIYGYSLAVVAYALPHIILSTLTNSRIQGRHRFSFWNEIYEVVLAPYILLPTLLALINPRLGKFNVTSKGGIVRRSFFDRRIALPYLLLLALNLFGLYKAGQRYLADPAHHDTIIMNSAWTLYNVVILSVAASVAWERRQRRSQVRVDLRVPFTLRTADNYEIAGTTSQLSLRGAAGKLDASARLSRGSRVTLTFDGEDSRCEIPAIVVQSRRQRQHFFFPTLALWQEQFLVNLVYSRPEAWVHWHRSHASDHILGSLTGILWLAVRGLGLVVIGFFTSRPPAREPLTSDKRERQPSIAASIACAVLLAGVPLGRCYASETTTQTNPAPTASAAPFHDEYELGGGGSQQTFPLQSAGASQNFFFGVPVMKVVSAATLKLHYSAPMLNANQSRLELNLNGTSIGAVEIVRGSDEQAEIILPTDLLTTDNTLTFQLQGACPECSRSHQPWVTIDAHSQLEFAGSKLPLPNDLALLPIPFFDAAGQRAWSLPVVFSEHPDASALQAASVVASWFGIFSDFRGVRFPVNLGELPEGNAIVLAVRGSALAANLSLPRQSGSLIAIRDNPHDPYGKLLIISGDRPEELLEAARALVTRNNYQSHTDAVRVGDLKLPARVAYSAPRWLATDKPATIGTYTTAERLQLKGSGSINIYFRLPPDLFLLAQQSVPLHLNYEYSGVSLGADAGLHVRLNGFDVDTIRLQPAASPTRGSGIIRLPSGRLQPYTNTLTIDFYFGQANGSAPNRQYAAIQRDSTLDLSALPHSVLLPRLELFGDAGYPFTKWPDLSQAAVVLPENPAPADYEAVLDMSGFCGAQTGTPVTGLSVTDAPHVDTVRDKDLLLIGTPETQPLLAEWQADMPISLVPEGMRVNVTPVPSRLLHPELPFRDRDWTRLSRVVSVGTPTDVIVEDFVSPFRSDRSVVAIAYFNKPDAIATLFMPATRQGPVYGGVALAQNGRFQSFLVGSRSYYSGELDPYQQATVFAFENYRLIPFAVVLLAFPIGAWLHRRTEVVAARRLGGI